MLFPIGKVNCPLKATRDLTSSTQIQCSHMQLHLHVVSVTTEHKQKSVYGLLLTTSIWENVALYKTGNKLGFLAPSH